MPKSKFAITFTVLCLSSPVLALKGEAWNDFFNSYVEACISEHLMADGNEARSEATEQVCRCRGVLLADAVIDDDSEDDIARKLNEITKKCEIKGKSVHLKSETTK